MPRGGGAGAAAARNLFFVCGVILCACSWKDFEAAVQSLSDSACDRTAYFVFQQPQEQGRC